ncbi:MAG TPA: alpha/beta hydrolase fold domain-containing protein [Candidatus Dormibacteraeota bacterium]|nr:alpha/beta hydrolase fold domain-containing protein [Candidatus Dormibacteraeota bacterium]
MYLAGQDPRQVLISPAHLADLTGFPPILLQASTNEVLLDDSTRTAARARIAGVDVILDLTADVRHVFHAFIGVLDGAGQASGNGMISTVSPAGQDLCCGSE